MKKNKTTCTHLDNFQFRGGENFQRMNYLLTLSTSIYGNIPYLSGVYVNQMKNISKRNALRINSKFKRLVCKCNNLLFMDKRSSLSLINKSGKHTLVIKCDKCSNVSETILF